jgi:hypothetical protein
MIYQPKGIDHIRLFCRIYKFLRIEHHLASVPFLIRVTYHLPNSPHIMLHLCVCIVHIHELYRSSNIHHRYLHQRELIFLYR